MTRTFDLWIFSSYITRFTIGWLATQDEIDTRANELACRAGFCFDQLHISLSEVV